MPPGVSISTRLGTVTVPAAPAKHQVEEVTFVIDGTGGTVYFAGDTLFIPELEQLPARFPHIDLALVPVNGLRIRPLFDKKIVMDAEDAGRLVAILRPALAIPHHYAFTSGPVGDRLLTKGDRDPQHFVDAAARIAPDVPVRVIRPGQRLDLVAAIR